VVVKLSSSLFCWDIARAVEIITRDDPAIRQEVAGKIIEAGGPDGKSLEPRIFDLT